MPGTIGPSVIRTIGHASIGRTGTIGRHRSAPSVRGPEHVFSGRIFGVGGDQEDLVLGRVISRLFGDFRGHTCSVCFKENRLQTSICAYPSSK